MFIIDPGENDHVRAAVVAEEKPKTIEEFGPKPITRKMAASPVLDFNVRVLTCYVSILLVGSVGGGKGCSTTIGPGLPGRGRGSGLPRHEGVRRCRRAEARPTGTR